MSICPCGQTDMVKLGGALMKLFVVKALTTNRPIIQSVGGELTWECGVLHNEELHAVELSSVQVNDWVLTNNNPLLYKIINREL
jgi:hypothetical protein